MFNLNLAQMKVLYKKAKKAYYNTDTPIMSDSKFDKLEGTIRDLDPRWKELFKTGVRIGKKSEVSLTYPMPSLSKVTDDDEEGLARWISKMGSQVTLTPKFDGCSVQVDYARGKPVRLVTRGDGVLGKDVSYFLPYVNLPNEVAIKTPFSVRMEAIFAVSRFEEKWSKEFRAARNAASGILNRQDTHSALRDLHFVALRLLKPKLGKHSEDLSTLKALGFEIPSRKMLSRADRLTTNALRQVLDSFREAVDFELDGVVVHSNESNLPHDKERPSHAFAWKLNDLENAATAIVKSVQWNVSSHGLLIPKAELVPIKVQGATIRFATCNNARWALDRGLGAGSVVKLIRSGEIIPKIVDVTKKSKLALPNKREVGDFAWDANKTHLVLTSPKESAAVQARRLDRFFKKVGIEFIAGGTSRKLVDAGFNSIERVLRMSQRDFLKLEGFGEKGAHRAKTSIDLVLSKGVDLFLLIPASGIFARGMGTRRLEQIAEVYPTLVHDSARVPKLELYDKISSVKGMPDVLARDFTDNIAKFWSFAQRTGIPIKPLKKARTTKGPLTGKGFTWTGYRSKEEEAWIASLGGSVVPFGSKTSVLFFSSTGKASSKVATAKAKGIPTLEFKRFKAKH